MNACFVRPLGRKDGACAPSANGDWIKRVFQVDIRKAKAQVYRLQMRIAKAARQQCYNKVRALQWLLSHSFYAKLLAVHRVVSNKGHNTPGIDGVLWNDDGSCQGICRLKNQAQAAACLLCAFEQPGSRFGFKDTDRIGSQLRVLPLQRSGFAAFASS